MKYVMIVDPLTVERTIPLVQYQNLVQIDFILQHSLLFHLPNVAQCRSKRFPSIPQIISYHTVQNHNMMILLGYLGQATLASLQPLWSWVFVYLNPYLCLQSILVRHLLFLSIHLLFLSSCTSIFMATY